MNETYIIILTAIIQNAQLRCNMTRLKILYFWNRAMFIRDLNALKPYFVF